MNKARPNLYIVGAGKAGTFALYTYLSQHPDVFMSPNKEPDFFGSDLNFRIPRISESQYLALFADGHNKKYRGEASVGYLLSYTAASQIRAYSPEARIIIILRNPIEVLQARHAQNLFSGEEDIRRFDLALAAEAQRRRGEGVPKETTVVDWLFYREWVNFSNQIRRYYESFPKEQIFVGLYDDLQRDSASFYKSVLRFLDLPPHSPPVFAQVNSRRRIRSLLLHRLLMGRFSNVIPIVRAVLPSRRVRGAIARALRRANVVPERQKGLPRAVRLDLERELAGEIRTLGQLLGRDLSHWLEFK